MYIFLIKNKLPLISGLPRVSAFTPRQCSFVTHLGTRRFRNYPHASAPTTRMWDNPATPTHPEMRRVSWGQSAQTTTKELSFAILLTVTQSTPHRECAATPKWRSVIHIYARKVS